jgi:hypothetical protein
MSWVEETDADTAYIREQTVDTKVSQGRAAASENTPAEPRAQNKGIIGNLTGIDGISSSRGGLANP